MRSLVRKQSFGSVTTLWLDRAELRRRLEVAAQALVAACPEVIGVHLFGSAADGRAVPGSDADVLVLLARSGVRWLDRPLAFARYVDECGIGVELFCYTVDEATRVPLARQALERGMLLAGRSGAAHTPEGPV
ncbi:MAG: nucleotidyltransferase domain-containing protein [Acidimicrobiales bacterium]